MIRQKDVAQMSAAERLAAVCAILAVGYRRLSLNRQKALAGGATGERPCDLVDSPENTGNQEVA